MTASRGCLQWDADVAITTAAARFHSAAVLTDPYGSAPLDLTLFVSCYNEAPYIVGTLDLLREAAKTIGLSYEIIVIDDGSRDNSRELIKDYIARHPDDNVILRANRENKGLAQNYVDGAFLGKGKYYRLICGDNAETFDSIRTIFSAIGEADILVPYYVSTEGKGWRRELISKTYTGIINRIAGNNLHYYNGLALHLRQNVVRWHSTARGFGFQADILCLLIDLGFTYKEIPVVMIERREGSSNAITLRNLVSVGHTIFEIFNRRISNLLYPR
jgi:glycosyltransferase involved in cell wall biosynthesis